MLKTALYLFAALQAPIHFVQESAVVQTVAIVKLDPCRVRVNGRSICRPNSGYPLSAKIEFFPEEADSNLPTPLQFANIATGRSKPDFRPGFLPINFAVLTNPFNPCSYFPNLPDCKETPGFAKIEFVPSDIEGLNRFANLAVGKFSSYRLFYRAMLPEKVCGMRWCTNTKGAA